MTEPADPSSDMNEYCHHNSCEFDMDPSPSEHPSEPSSPHLTRPSKEPNATLSLLGAGSNYGG